MDLGKLDTVSAANAGIELCLLHPKTSEPTSIYITVLGSDSDEFRKISATQNRARLMRIRKSQATRHRSDEDFEGDAIAILAACTKGWRDGSNESLDIGGSALPFSVENAILLYRKFPWIREQVDITISDRTNFIKG